MKVLDRDEMKRIDSYTCSNLKPAIRLMEEAGYQIYWTIKYKYKFTKALILCGSKGNGGDAFVAGRFMLKEGYKVDAFLISDNFNDECKENYEKFEGKVYRELPDLNQYDLILDGLIGISCSGSLKDNYKDVITKVNNSGKIIVSIDVPTGIDSYNGIGECYIKSDLCITVEYPKLGLFLNNGKNSYKELEVISLGMIDPDYYYNINELKDFKGLYKERPLNSNKGTFGKATIIAGSYKYPGASLISLNALNQFKMGVGYSRLYVPNEVYNLYQLHYPELIVNTIPTLDGHIKYDKDSLDEIIKVSDSIAIGMGMDVSKDLYDAINYLINNYTKPLIIDADGINSISKYGNDILNNSKGNIILTPHIMEFSRLIGVDRELILSDSIKYVKEFTNKYNVTLILKSSSSIISNKDSLSINITGNSALAKAGSGDMLSGILCGLCAYLDCDINTKAKLASYMLGRCSELASINTSEESLTATEISNYIPNVIKEIKMDC